MFCTTPFEVPITGIGKLLGVLRHVLKRPPFGKEETGALCRKASHTYPLANRRKGGGENDGLQRHSGKRSDARHRVCV